LINCLKETYHSPILPVQTIISGINSGHHNLPTYEMSLKSDIVEFVRYCVSAISKMTSGRNFSMSGHHYLPTFQILMISDNVEFLRPFWQWRPLEIFRTTHQSYKWDRLYHTRATNGIGCTTHQSYKWDRLYHTPATNGIGCTAHQSYKWVKLY
jgi:hypothetical protein